MHTKNGELAQGFRSCFWCVGYWSGVKLGGIFPVRAAYHHWWCSTRDLALFKCSDPRCEGHAL